MNPDRRQIKLTVVGPGAMGCLLAGILCRRGCLVSMLDYKAERAQRLKANGIQVESEDNIRTSFPEVVSEPGKLGLQDFVIFLVKAGQTTAAVNRIGPLIGPATLLVSLQNGIGHESVLSKIVKPEQIVLGTTAQGATLLSEGCIRHAGKGPTTLGLVIHNPDTMDRLISLTTLLKDVGWPAQIVEDIYPYIWRKLIVNVGINALTALSGLANGELLKHKESLQLQELAVTEAWDLSKNKGVALGLSLDDAIEMVRSVCKATAQNRSSMLQDRIKNRHTEIDYINGAVTNMGKKLGLATPVNETLTLLVRLNSCLGWKVPIIPDTVS